MLKESKSVTDYCLLHVDKRILLEDKRKEIEGDLPKFYGNFSSSREIYLDDRLEINFYSSVKEFYANLPNRLARRIMSSRLEDPKSNINVYMENPDTLCIIVRRGLHFFD